MNTKCECCGIDVNDVKEVIKRANALAEAFLDSEKTIAILLEQVKRMKAQAANE